MNNHLTASVLLFDEKMTLCISLLCKMLKPAQGCMEIRVTSQSKASPCFINRKALLNWLQNPSDATTLADKHRESEGNYPVEFQHEKER